MSTYTSLTQPKNKTDRRTFTWRCWYNGHLTDVVINPPAREEKNTKQGGVSGRIYQRQGNSLKTISGVVHQDNDGRVYFIPKG